MRNYLQSSDFLVVAAAPYAVLSGAGCRVGKLFGVAMLDAASGASASLIMTGVFTLTKTASDTFAVGDLVYWDNTAKSVTSTSTSNVRIGVATAAAAGADTVATVRLDGVVI